MVIPGTCKLKDYTLRFIGTRREAGDFGSGNAPVAPTEIFDVSLDGAPVG